GYLVLSNRPVGPVEPTYSVPKAESIRVTRPVAAQLSATYDDLIAEHSRANDVRPDLVRAVVQVESAFNPNARSPKGAMGLMQLMPSTARQFGVTNAYNPAENVRASVARPLSEQRRARARRLQRRPGRRGQVSPDGAPLR